MLLQVVSESPGKQPTRMFMLENLSSNSDYLSHIIILFSGYLSFIQISIDQQQGQHDNGWNLTHAVFKAHVLAAWVITTPLV